MSDQGPSGLPPPPDGGRGAPSWQGRQDSGEPRSHWGDAAGPGWDQPAGGGDPGWGGGPPYGQPRQPATNGLAIAALIVGIIALPLTVVLIGGLIGLVAVVLGFLAIRRASDLGGSGRGLAIGGIVAGALSLVFAGLVLFAGIALLQDPEVREGLERELERMEQEQPPELELEDEGNDF